MNRLRVAVLGSGSTGNSTLIASGSTTLLLDCGFTLKETVARCTKLGVSLENVDAILITHEHGDHLRGMGPISRKFDIPVWLTHGTYGASKDKKIPRVNFFHAHETFEIGDIQVVPFPTPHDAAESCQFVFSFNGCRFACVTDLGACTPHVRSKIVGCNGILIESNYDLEMLRNGPYPQSLQSRIASNYGHLGNEQAGALLNEIDHEALNTILLGHLSERNNSVKNALETVSGYLSNTGRITVLQQHECSRWFELESSAVRESQTMENQVVENQASEKPPLLTIA